jgi:predicted O-linked N-acetylglucosamine transferase (SPINDLY family)
MASRVAGSQLHAAGLPELVTTGLAEYEALAFALAAQPELLRSYRARLAANRGTAPLFDLARYTRAFEAAMERIWADYAASTPT